VPDHPGALLDERTKRRWSPAQPISARAAGEASVASGPSSLRQPKSAFKPPETINPENQPTPGRPWDCSGYVQWIYKRAGINLPRVDQWTVGHETENSQPGGFGVAESAGTQQLGARRHLFRRCGEPQNPDAGTLWHPVEWNTGTAYFDLLDSFNRSAAIA